MRISSPTPITRANNTLIKMLDIVFCSIPYSNFDRVYSAPAILKGIAVANGFTAKTKDFGPDLLSMCSQDLSRLDHLQTYFIGPNNLSDSDKLLIDKFYDKCVDWFLANPARYISISVFSIFTHKSSFELLHKIKKAGITSEILVGGRGLKVKPFENVRESLQTSATERLLDFAQFLKKRKLIDHAIIGDGEDALLELLKEGVVKQVEYNSDEFRSPIPDYSDYNFNDYFFPQEIMLPVTGSKGCVRDCDFCDVKFQFGKYRYRSGKDIANEIISLSKQYNVYKFQFTDSLVNGGLKPFREFLETMSEYNLNNPDKKIKWDGQYICRTFKHNPKDLYRLLKDSGANGLTIGAETLSNKVLEKMNKKTTVEDLFFELEEFRKHNITCMLLTIVGHWSETWEDFQDHCRMLIKLTPYVRSGTISAIGLGFTMWVLDGTPSGESYGQENGIVRANFNKEPIWFCKNNPDNTFKQRVYRRLIVSKLCKKLNIPTGATEFEHLLNLNNITELQYKEINEFYKQNLTAEIDESYDENFKSTGV